MRLSYIAAALASAITLCEGSSKMVIGYLPNWLNNAEYPIESIPFNKYTHINYGKLYTQTTRINFDVYNQGPLNDSFCHFK